MVQTHYPWKKSCSLTTGYFVTVCHLYSYWVLFNSFGITCVDMSWINAAIQQTRSPVWPAFITLLFLTQPLYTWADWQSVCMYSNHYFTNSKLVAESLINCRPCLEDGAWGMMIVIAKLYVITCYIARKYSLPLNLEPFDVMESVWFIISWLKKDTCSVTWHEM